MSMTEYVEGTRLDHHMIASGTTSARTARVVSSRTQGIRRRLDSSRLRGGACPLEHRLGAEGDDEDDDRVRTVQQPGDRRLERDDGEHPLEEHHAEQDGGVLPGGLEVRERHDEGD